MKMKTTIIPNGFDMKPEHPVEFASAGIRRAMRDAIEHLEPLTYVVVPLEAMGQMEKIAKGE